MGAWVSAGAATVGVADGGFCPSSPPGPIMFWRPPIAIPSVEPPVKGAAMRPPAVISGPMIFWSIPPIEPGMSDHPRGEIAVERLELRAVLGGNLEQLLFFVDVLREPRHKSLIPTLSTLFECVLN